MDKETQIPPFTIERPTKTNVLAQNVDHGLLCKLEIFFLSHHAYDVAFILAYSLGFKFTTIIDRTFKLEDPYLKDDHDPEIE